MVSTGSNSVIFWNCEGNILDCCVCHVSKMEFSHLAGDFTSSQFLCGSNSVVTATSEGYIIVWEPINERTGGSAAEKELKSKKKVLKAASKVTTYLLLLLAVNLISIHLYEKFRRACLKSIMFDCTFFFTHFK
jgi:hypothetical protein